MADLSEERMVGFRGANLVEEARAQILLPHGVPEAGRLHASDLRAHGVPLRADGVDRVHVVAGRQLGVQFMHL